MRYITRRHSIGLNVKMDNGLKKFSKAQIHDNFSNYRVGDALNGASKVSPVGGVASESLGGCAVRC